jgi:ABC-type glutathione transport system ATPase component
MRQRVMIAMAVILHPRLLIADEPTTALDVTIQNQIIALLKEINERENNSMLFITHDLNLARRICHRVVVMKDGHVVEMGDTEQIFKSPKDGYTKTLIEAVPSRVKKPERYKRQTDAEKVLEVKDLNVYYRESGNSLFAGSRRSCVVQNAGFDILKGEVMGLVGESGCGKTSLSKAILGMNKNIKGSIVHNSKYPQMIFQDPYSSLNPSKTIGWLLQEPLRAMGRLEPSLKMSKSDMKEAAVDMLKTVGMKESYFDRKPSQLSGGQRQRISIGQALITRPSLVIADEPVSALDVTLQAQIMELMLKLKEEMGLSYLFISHDINVVYHMCDRIMVMKSGQIVEMGDTEEIFNNPQDEYTKLLLSGA